MPVDAESILKYCIDCNISALELMGPTAEAFAGAPHTTTEPAARGGRNQTSDDERAARAKDLAHGDICCHG